MKFLGNLFKRKAGEPEDNSETTPVLEFGFYPNTKTIIINGQEFDGRKILRDLEGELRMATNIPQITVEFIPDTLVTYSVQVDYDAKCGYTVQWYPLMLDPEEAEKCKAYAVNYIKQHARTNGIEPTLPPLPGKVIGIEKSINVDTRQNRTEAIAHDGRRLIAFYTNLERTDYFMLKQVPALHIVHIQFESKDEYKRYMNEVKSDCSAFLKLANDWAKAQSEFASFVQEHLGN